jgi:hypothetical protein
MKSRRIRSVGHVAYIETVKIHTEFVREDLKGRDHVRDLGVDGKITL